MKFVVKECLSVSPRASSARLASVDGALFGVSPIDFSGNGLVRIAAGWKYRKRRRMAECPDIRRFIAMNQGIHAGGVGKAIQNIVYAMRGELS